MDDIDESREGAGRPRGLCWPYKVGDNLLDVKLQEFTHLEIRRVGRTGDTNVGMISKMSHT